MCYQYVPTVFLVKFPRRLFLKAHPETAGLTCSTGAIGCFTYVVGSLHSRHLSFEYNHRLGCDSLPVENIVAKIYKERRNAAKELSRVWLGPLQVLALLSLTFEPSPFRVVCLLCQQSYINSQTAWALLAQIFRFPNEIFVLFQIEQYFYVHNMYGPQPNSDGLQPNSMYVCVYK